MLKSLRVIPVDVAFAAVAAAEYHLANVGGLVPLEEMTADDAKTFERLRALARQQDVHFLPGSGFQERFLAEHRLNAALGDYLENAGGTDQRLMALDQNVFGRAGRISAAVHCGDGIAPGCLCARRPSTEGNFLDY